MSNVLSVGSVSLRVELCPGCHIGWPSDSFICCAAGRGFKEVGQCLSCSEVLADRWEVSDCQACRVDAERMREALLAHRRFMQCHAIQILPKVPDDQVIEHDAGCERRGEL